MKKLIATLAVVAAFLVLTQVSSEAGLFSKDDSPKWSSSKNPSKNLEIGIKTMDSDQIVETERINSDMFKSPQKTYRKPILAGGSTIVDIESAAQDIYAAQYNAGIRTIYRFDEVFGQHVVVYSTDEVTDEFIAQYDNNPLSDTPLYFAGYIIGGTKERSFNWDTFKMSTSQTIYMVSNADNIIEAKTTKDFYNLPLKDAANYRIELLGRDATSFFTMVNMASFWDREEYYTFYNNWSGCANDFKTRYSASSDLYYDGYDIDYWINVMNESREILDSMPDPSNPWTESWDEFEDALEGFQNYTIENESGRGI